jgi:hypothetical protein
MLGIAIKGAQEVMRCCCKRWPSGVRMLVALVDVQLSRHTYQGYIPTYLQTVSNDRF